MTDLSERSVSSRIHLSPLRTATPGLRGTVTVLSGSSISTRGVWLPMPISSDTSFLVNVDGDFTFPSTAVRCLTGPVAALTTLTHSSPSALFLSEIELCPVEVTLIYFITQQMPDYLGSDQRKTKDQKDDEKPIKGLKESDTGLAPPALWDLAADKTYEHPLQVARCTKIINSDTEEPKYIINVKQFAKFVVDLADSVAPTDIEEGMRVGVDRTKYQIHIPLPPKIDPSVTMMQVEDKPDVTYSDVGGCKEQIEKLREVVELPLLHKRFLIASGPKLQKNSLNLHICHAFCVISHSKAFSVFPSDRLLGQQ
ncbi:unnamed protein product [Schistosoma mattheei]|uniref:Uncharacterized protein n=1 Tax=Schistosoma mattheei TaxID=31246 RepID=A0A183PQ83_9TREM|nr:unnamed protein product [Schistosoma mattheei]